MYTADNGCICHADEHNGDPKPADEGGLGRHAVAPNTKHATNARTPSRDETHDETRDENNTADRNHQNLKPKPNYREKYLKARKMRNNQA